MTADPFAELKLRQRQMWSSFAPTAVFTTPVAAQLVAFAGVAPGEAVLDVGCGTGVVAVTAARAGARVSGLDLTPELIAVARDNAALAGVQVDLREGDAEALPFEDGAFDVVLSQFGHMFAPRPDVTLSEMRRVLKPGGRVAFATWPPEHFVGRFFALTARHGPPPPPGAAPPPLWGDVATIRERLAAAGFAEPFFGRGVMGVPTLSPAHLRVTMERTIGPLQKLVESLESEPQKLQALRSELEALAKPFIKHNVVQQDYLLTRASLA